jgi:hypothetical protein
MGEKVNLGEAIKKKKAFEANLIIKALEDEGFRKELLEDPKAVIERESGQKLPEGVEIRVIEESPNSVTFILPRKPEMPDTKGELSDEALENVAGGAVVSVPYCEDSYG